MRARRPDAAHAAGSTRVRDVGRDDLSGRRHALRRQQRLELDRGPPLKGTECLLGERIDSHAYEPHDITLSHELVDCTSSRQERHPAEPGTWRDQQRPDHPTPVSGGNAAAAVASRASNQYQFQLERASLVSARCRGTTNLDNLRAGRAQQLYTHRDQRARRARHALLTRRSARHLRRQENHTFDQVLGD